MSHEYGIIYNEILLFIFSMVKRVLHYAKQNTFI